MTACRRTARLHGRGLARSGLGEQSPGQADLAAAREADAEIDAKIARDGLPVARAALPQ